MKGALTISRPMTGGESKEIHIKVKDAASRISFLSLTIPLADFAAALTGLSEVECQMEIVGLDKVGMKRVKEGRRVLYPHTSYNKKEMEACLIENCQEEGWLLSPYLGSQQSVERKNGETHLNYSVIKYV